MKYYFQKPLILGVIYIYAYDKILVHGRRLSNLLILWIYHAAPRYGLLVRFGIGYVSVWDHRTMFVND